MTLDEILRKYMAHSYPEVALDPDFKLHVDSDGDIALKRLGDKYPDYIYTSEGGELPGLIQFILDEAGVK